MNIYVNIEIYLRIHAVNMIFVCGGFGTPWRRVWLLSSIVTITFLHEIYLVAGSSNFNQRNQLFIMQVSFGIEAGSVVYCKHVIVSW